MIPGATQFTVDVIRLLRQLHREQLGGADDAALDEL